MDRTRSAASGHPNDPPPECCTIGCGPLDGSRLAAWSGACPGHFFTCPNGHRSELGVLLAKSPPKWVGPFWSTLSSVWHDPGVASGHAPDVLAGWASGE